MAIHDSHHASVYDTDPDLNTSWQVVSFVDPAGTGGDLAFTEGLSALGLPELLLWARPTEGLDPGVDWLLTHRERSRLLNRWAFELINDTLRPGTGREERFDGGHSIARFRFSRANFASPLQHPYLPDRTRVICTTWSLLRDAPAPPAPLSASAAQRMERWIAASDAVTFGWQLDLDPLDDPALQSPPGMTNWLERLEDSLGGPPDGDRFGPLTRWVEARISQVLAAGPEVLSAFLERLVLAELARSEDTLLDNMTRVATRHRRNSVCREASRVAQELGLLLTGPPGLPTPSWQRTTTLVTAPSQITADAEAEAEAEAYLRTTLSDGLESLLVAAALADVVPPSTTASAAGPWEWAANDHQLPGRLWLARPSHRRAARDLLTPATPAVLAAAVEHAQQSGEQAEHREVGWMVAGLQTTAAAAAQPRALLRRDQSRGLPMPIVRAADQLAGQLLTAVALPYRFPDDSWDLLRELLRPLVPAFPAELRVEIP